MSKKLTIARRAAAGLALTAGLTLGAASAAHGQATPKSPESPATPNPSPTTTTPTTTVKTSGATARTGAELWIPLAAGGATIALGIGARGLLRSRTG